MIFRLVAVKEKGGKAQGHGIYHHVCEVVCSNTFVLHVVAGLHFQPYVHLFRFFSTAERLNSDPIWSLSQTYYLGCTYMPVYIADKHSIKNAVYMYPNPLSATVTLW
jgi:hypothetical protein